MSAFFALQDMMRRYVQRDITLQNLHHWLASNAQNIADDSMEESSMLSEAAWTAISEFSAGDLGENGVRAAVTNVLGLALPAFGHAECRTGVNVTVVPIHSVFSPAPRYSRMPGLVGSAP